MKKFRGIGKQNTYKAIITLLTLTVKWSIKLTTFNQKHYSEQDLISVHLHKSDLKCGSLIFLIILFTVAASELTLIYNMINGGEKQHLN